MRARAKKGRRLTVSASLLALALVLGPVAGGGEPAVGAVGDSVTLLAPEPVPVSGGSPLVHVSCSGGRPCNGTLSIQAAEPALAPGVANGTLGSTTFALGPGQSKSVAVEPVPQAAAVVRKAQTPIVIVLTETDLARRTRTSTIGLSLAAG